MLLSVYVEPAACTPRAFKHAPPTQALKLQDKGVPVPVGIPEAAALASTAALWGAAFYAYYAATAEEVEVRHGNGVFRVMRVNALRRAPSSERCII